MHCGKRVLPAAPEDAIVCPRERHSTEVVEESRGFSYLVNLLFLRFSHMFSHQRTQQEVHATVSPVQSLHSTQLSSTPPAYNKALTP